LPIAGRATVVDGKPSGRRRHRPRRQRPRPASGPLKTEPRPRAQRRHDAEHRHTHNVDVSASADGTPHLVPLSFDWDGEVATEADSPSDGNVTDTWTTRLVLGHTRDMSVIDGEVEVLAIDELPQEQGDRLAAHTGFDPRTLTTPYRWFLITARRIQAWCEENEPRGRRLIRDSSPRHAIRWSGSRTTSRNHRSCIQNRLRHRPRHPCSRRPKPREVCPGGAIRLPGLHGV
jgi:hypothetical protein